MHVPLQVVSDILLMCSLAHRTYQISIRSPPRLVYDTTLRATLGLPSDLVEPFTTAACTKFNCGCEGMQDHLAGRYGAGADTAAPAARARRVSIVVLGRAGASDSIHAPPQTQRDAERDRAAQ